jgi:hypothetical protein
MLVLAQFHRDIFASQTPRPATPHVSNTSLNTAIRNGSAAATVRACSFQAINGRLAGLKACMVTNPVSCASAWTGSFNPPLYRKLRIRPPNLMWRLRSTRSRSLQYKGHSLPISIYAERFLQTSTARLPSLYLIFDDIPYVLFYFVPGWTFER